MKSYFSVFCNTMRLSHILTNANANVRWIKKGTKKWQRKNEKSQILARTISYSIFVCVCVCSRMLPVPRTCRIYAGIEYDVHYIFSICVNIFPHSWNRRRINHRKSNRHTFHLVLDRFSTSCPSLIISVVSVFSFFTQFVWIRFVDFSPAVSHVFLLLFFFFYSLLLIHVAECVLVLQCVCSVFVTNEAAFAFVYILLNERYDDDDKTIWWRHQ